MGKLKTFGLFVLIFLAGCVKQVDWPIPDAQSGLIVVDGTITDRQGVQAVKITSTVNQLNQVPRGIAGATVRISNEDSVWTLTEDTTGSGIYKTPSWFSATTGKNYTLQIIYNNKVYSAKTYMVPGTTFPELTWEKNPGDELYHINYVASAFSTRNPAMWEVLLDWSMVPGYTTQDPEKCRARILFYTLPTLDVSEVFAPAVEKVSFPAGTIITQNRYSLNTDHAEFIRELLLETTWQGGFFPSESANLRTNLSSGATGYFGACSLTSLSLTVTP